jgi:arsenate reductase
MMKIYHNPRCTKSRQTLELIREAGIEPEIVEYLNDVPTEAELKELVAMLGIKPYDLLRRGETDFKENFKGKELSDDEWIAAIVKYPKLIERPIVVKQKKAVLGRPPENVKTLL